MYKVEILANLKQALTSNNIIIKSNHCAYVNLCFVTRIIEPIDASLLNTSANVIVVKKAEGASSKAVTIYEACSAIGYTLGPPIGSLFFSLGGFKLPFIVLGVFVLLNLPGSLYCLGNNR
ncbi:MFS-type transporter SLC18B1-like protein, partial [Leptotrombidium deliense]